MKAAGLAVEYLIQQFDLKPHPEGGYYQETYRSNERVARQQSGAQRSASTAIYYLLSGSAYSAWHRIASDEVWHFYTGSPLHVHVLTATGLLTQRLGNTLEHKQAVYQIVVPAGCWFAAELVDVDSYAFVGCTVAPGFEFSEFELADTDMLLASWPQHAALIRRLGAR